MEQNYSVVPFRPAGGVWTSAHDMTRYALLELAGGKLPDGRQFVSEENLLMRRKPQISTGEDQAYGMGLSTNDHWGIPIVHHVWWKWCSMESQKRWLPWMQRQLTTAPWWRRSGRARNA